MIEKASRGNKGFTLIELIVVVAIISIVASLLLPALAKGKAVSKKSQCKGNLRQLALALEMYVSDSDGALPTYEWAPKVRRFNWEIAVSRNISKSATAGGRFPFLHCPSGRQGVMHETVPGKVFSLSASPTYGYNSFGFIPSGSPAYPDAPAGLGGFNPPDEPNQVVPTRESQINSPAEMLAFGDGFRAKLVSRGIVKLEESFYLGRVPNIGFASPGEWTSSAGREEGLAEERHDGTLNMAFSDGHVTSAKVEQWYFSNAEVDLRRWRTDNKAK